MSLLEYHQSIGKELTDLQNRVRCLLGDNWHRYSDGKHKESILRNVLLRHLPAAVSALNGFIRYPNSCSSEIDILMFHNDRPLLFRSDDLVITTPVTVFGGIEVKTKLRTGNLHTALTKIASNSSMTIEEIKKCDWQSLNISHIEKATFPWFSLFAFDSEVNDQTFLTALDTNADGNIGRALKCACLGPNKFVRFWNHKNEPPHTNESFTGWRLYELSGLSFSYFISNMIWQDQTSSSESQPWFALDDKETRLIAEKPLTIPRST